MDQYLSTLQPGLLDPITDWSKLGFEGVDTVITDALDVQHLDSALPLLDPQ
jgi:hypothetical protein